MTGIYPLSDIMLGAKMNILLFKEGLWKTALMIVFITALNFALLPFIGHQAVGFIFLLAVLVLSLFVSFTHLVIFAVFSAAIWDFFFIPPHGTFLIAKTEDLMMNLVYIFAAIVTGYLASQIRRKEKLLATKEAQEGLYHTILDSVSHELKTPATAILGIASALQSTELGQDLMDSAERLDHILTNLLDMSRLSSVALRMKKEWQDVGDLIEVCLRELKEKLSKHKVILKIEEGLPLVRMDFILFEQALVNILLNAALYSPEGGEITLSANREGDKLVLKIMDQGPGVEETELPHIFDKFYRAKGASPGGTGLGLAIAKGVVAAHQGKLEAKNREGGGLEIIITLPLEKQPELKGGRSE